MQTDKKLSSPTGTTMWRRLKRTSDIFDKEKDNFISRFSFSFFLKLIFNRIISVNLLDLWRTQATATITLPLIYNPPAFHSFQRITSTPTIIIPLLMALNRRRKGRLQKDKR
jgi:hypothetical protein